MAKIPFWIYKKNTQKCLLGSPAGIEVSLFGYIPGPFSDMIMFVAPGKKDHVFMEPC